MRSSRLTPIALLLYVLLTAPPARSNGSTGRDDFAMLGAVLTLAAVGLSKGRSDLILSAAEVAAEVSPQGSPRWIDTLLEEARFLARGDAALLSRASAITVSQENSALRLVPLDEAMAGVALPDGTRLGRISPPPGHQMRTVQDADGRECNLRPGQPSDCTHQALTGRITVRGLPAMIGTDLPVIVELLPYPGPDR